MDLIGRFLEQQKDQSGTMEADEVTTGQRCWSR